MGDRKKKAGRKKAAAGAPEGDEVEAGKVEEGAQLDKASRRQAKAGRRERSKGGAGGGDQGQAPRAEEIEARLARIEEAVASQAERSEALSAKLDEVLHEARKSARHAKSADLQAGE